MNKGNSGKKCIVFIGALTLAFFILKLCDLIDWDWVWILSPLWITMLLVLVAVLFYIFID